MKEIIALNVNGELKEVMVAHRTTLLEVLREQLGLTGVKDSCGTGDCGVCTVLMDGKAVSACLILAVRAKGKRIETIEGLSQEGDYTLCRRLSLIPAPSNAAIARRE